MKDLWWFSIRLLKSKNSALFSTNGLISLIGLSIGVASLVVSMAVVSGFEATLRKSIIDVAGHIQIFNFDNKELDLNEIKNIAPDMISSTTFYSIEGVAAFQGQVNGVYIQALNPDTVDSVLNLKNRIFEGQFDIRGNRIVIGKSLAQKLGVKIGDVFRVIVPQKNEMEPGDFKRVILRFEISGIISFGKYEFDERLLVTNDQFLIAMGLLSKRAPGLILGLKDSDLARETADRLRSKLSDTNRVRDWKEFSENLFEAVKIERVVIFFVIMVIVIAAAFNVSITQYINVVRKYADIAILKTLGVSQKNLIKIFCIQGLFLGVIGVFIGFILGYLMCFGFEYLEANYNILPFSVYKVDHIKLHLRGWDALYIVVSSIIVCLVSSYAPALKGANLKPVEGLRYE